MSRINRIPASLVVAGRSLRSEEKGGTTVLVALSAPVIVGALGAGVDTGAWYMEKHRVQRIADSAALGGARALAGGQDESTAQAIANRDAARNGFSAGASQTIVVNSPPTSGTYAGKTGAVEVIVTRSLPSLFSSYMLGTAARAVRGRAVAAMKTAKGGAGSGCILAKDTTRSGAISLTGNAALSAPDCFVAANSTSLSALTAVGNANVTAYTLYLGGQDTLTGNARVNVTEAAHLHYSGVTDPYEDLYPTPTLSGACLKTNYKLNGNGAATLSPGRYCGGISVSSNGKLTLRPGTYYMDAGNFTIDGNGVVTCSSCGGGAGVTIVFTASSTTKIGTANISGNASVTLSPPGADSGQPYPGLVFCQDPRAPADAKTASMTGNGALKLSGVLYFPSNTLKLSGNGGLSEGYRCTILIARSIEVMGNGSLSTTDCAAMGVKPPVVMESALGIVE